VAAQPDPPVAPAHELIIEALKRTTTATTTTLINLLIFFTLKYL